MRTTMQIVLGLMVVAALGVGAAWFFGVLSAESTPSAKSGDNQPVRVEVVQPKRRISVQPAQVEPMERVEVVVKIPGYLKELGKDSAGKEIDTGSRVKAGQVLALLSVPELEKELKLKKASRQESIKSAQAAQERLKLAEKDRAKYEAELRFHDSELKRYEKLFKDRAIDKSLLDEKRSRMEAAVASVESAEARIGQARAELETAEARCLVCEADMERLAELVAYATLRVPEKDSDALYVVTRRWADPGTYLQPGSGSQRDAILSLVRVDRVEVVCDVPELDAAAVEVGDRAVFQAGALPGRKFEGKVSRHSAALDPQTRTLRVEIDFDNADGKPLYPGMYGSVTLSLREPQDVWLIPAAAIRQEDGQPFVFVVADGKIEKVPVTVGGPVGNQVEILKGLTPKSAVVTRAFGTVKPEQAVTAVEAKGK